LQQFQVPEGIKHRTAVRRHHIVTAGCRMLQESNTMQVASETGRQRVPITKELNTFIKQKRKDLEKLKPFTNIANLKETWGGKQK
jgi:hypothetical protein